MLTPEQMWSRIGRLETLSEGLGREADLIEEGNDPLLNRERMTYLVALRDAVGAIEDARTILTQARQRMSDPSRRT